jgi:hypothetical protein
MNFCLKSEPSLYIYLIFLDKSGVNLAIVRLYAPSLKGEMASQQKPNKRGKNVSISTKNKEFEKWKSEEEIHSKFLSDRFFTRN